MSYTTQSLKNRIASAMVMLKQKRLSLEVAATEALMVQLCAHDLKKDVAGWINALDEQTPGIFTPSLLDGLREVSREGFVSRFFSPGAVDASLLEDYRSVIAAMFSDGLRNYPLIPPSSKATVLVNELAKNPLKKAESGADEIESYMAPYDKDDSDTQWVSWWIDTLSVIAALYQAYQRLQIAISTLPLHFKRTGAREIEFGSSLHRYGDGFLDDWLWIYLLYADVDGFQPASYDVEALIEVADDAYRNGYAPGEVGLDDFNEADFASPGSADNDVPIAAAAGFAAMSGGQSEAATDADAASDAMASGGDLGSFS